MKVLGVIDAFYFFLDFFFFLFFRLTDGEESELDDEEDSISLLKLDSFFGSNGVAFFDCSMESDRSALLLSVPILS